MNKNKIFTFVALLVFVALGGILHLYRISYPPSPVFDEAHFATYAADYVKHKAFFDIHPPLGKLIYAAALSLTADFKQLRDMDFFRLKLISGKDQKSHIVVIDNHRSFDDFPYLRLRILGAIFGIFLPLVFYWFLRSIGVSNIGALLGALFVVLDNAILVETRLILLNGMYLVFGFAAMTLYFKNLRQPALAGLLWGAALGVKLISIVFAGPILIYRYLTNIAASRSSGRIHGSDLIKFLAISFFVLVAVYSVDSFIFSVKERLAILKDIGLISDSTARSSSKLVATAGQVVLSLEGYTAGLPHESQSPWYFWPAMQVPMNYYSESYYSEPLGIRLKQIVLTGNPVVWFSSTLAVIFAIAMLPRYLKNYFQNKNTESKPLFILLAGFLSGILPYFTIIRRSTFLYHYFPSLMFAMGLLAWFISKMLKLDDFDALSRKQLAAIVVIFVLTLGGFFLTAPLTYGL